VDVGVLARADVVHEGDLRAEVVEIAARRHAVDVDAHWSLRISEWHRMPIGGEQCGSVQREDERGETTQRGTASKVHLSIVIGSGVPAKQRSLPACKCSVSSTQITQIPQIELH
jgi:hypothetical protein